MRWTTLSIAVFLGLSGDLHSQVAWESSRIPLREFPTQGRAAWSASYPPSGYPTTSEYGASGCISCHKGYEVIFEHPMALRPREKSFALESIGKVDPDFFETNCHSCHVKTCLDCHRSNGHPVSKPGDEVCLKCHKGYFVGADYYGMAPREDHLRFKRGPLHEGDNYLKMIPDVHKEAGLKCLSCHTMQSFLTRRKAARDCLDCHVPSTQVLEHTIPRHSEMECYACHSAWASQEYGTFFIRFTRSPMTKSMFTVTSHQRDWARIAYLRTQDAPPLGINSRGKVSPIRPQFIVFFTDVMGESAVGPENRLLTATWKAFFPHTIRRGTVMCDGCHTNPRRLLMEREQDRIYDLQKDGLTLKSFWDRAGQIVRNGDFLPAERVARMLGRGKAYQRSYVEKWRRVIQHVERYSAP